MKENDVKQGKGIMKYINGNEYNGEWKNNKKEGEYFNDKRNGKGKEYDYDGNLLFEGQYLYNFKRKGKEYYSNGKLKYDGEYLFDNKYNGKGYEQNGNIIFELNNGNGKIKEHINDELKIEGDLNEEIEEDKYNGEIKFEGEYLNGKKWNGKRKEYNDNGKLIFEDEFLDGKKIESKKKEFFSFW